MKNPNQAIDVLIVDEDAERSRNLRGALALAGYRVVHELRGSAELEATVRARRPQIIIIAADSPDRDTLEHISVTVRNAPRPVVMFSQDEDGDTIRDAVRAGVSAYIVDGLTAERIRGILEVACAQFEAHQALADRLADTERQLAERKRIERAKGLLMSRRGLSEEAAYKELRQLAMQTGKPLGEVADTVITAAHLL